MLIFTYYIDNINYKKYYLFYIIILFNILIIHIGQTKYKTDNI